MWELPPPQVGGKNRRGFGMNLTGVFYGHLSVSPVSEQEPGVEESTGHETLGVDSV